MRVSGGEVFHDLISPLKYSHMYNQCIHRPMGYSTEHDRHNQRQQQSSDLSLLYIIPIMNFQRDHHNAQSLCKQVGSHFEFKVTECIEIGCSKGQVGQQVRFDTMKRKKTTNKESLVAENEVQFFESTGFSSAVTRLLLGWMGMQNRK